MVTFPYTLSVHPEALKLEGDTRVYAYLNGQVSKVNDMDDASNFRAVQVSAQCGQGWALGPSSEPRTCEWRPWASPTSSA